MDEKTYKNRVGLLNSPHSNEPHNINENSFLFSLAHLLREYTLTSKWNSMTSAMLYKHLGRVREIGFFLTWHRNVLPGDGLKQDQYTSRDQLIAYAVFSKLTTRIRNKQIGQIDALDDHFWIYDTIKAKKFTYDNVAKKVNFKRLVRARDWIYLGYLAKSPTCYVLMPWYYLNNIFTVLRAGPKRASGLQLLWLQSFVDFHIMSKTFWKIANYILAKKFGTRDWETAMLSAYYPLDHDINLLGAKERSLP